MITTELKDMTYVLAVYRAGTFSRAAEILYISQPSLSKIVKRVESDLGVVIFDRSRSPLQLTASGEICVEYFQKILGMRQELDEFCSSFSTRKKDADLRIGAPSFFCTYALPPMVSAYQGKHPECTVKLFESNDFELRSYLSAGVVDVGLSVEPEPFESLFLHEEELIFAVPGAYSVNQTLTGSALTVLEVCAERYRDPDCPAVSMGAFRKERFLFLKSGNDAYRRGLKICRAAGFEPHITMELDQMLTAYYLACAGEGVALIRAAIPQYIDGGQLVFYKIDSPHSTRPLRAFYKKKTPELASFLAFMKDYRHPQ